MSRRSGNCFRCCLVIFAVISALCVSGPALYWKLNKALKFKASCSPCKCHCSPPLSILDIAPGLANLTIKDCGKDDPDLKDEMEKQYVDLLSEELKLQEAVNRERARRMNTTVTDARRLASEYRQEAEKCNTATETCEVRREGAEVLLAKERKLSALWEKRALKLGWSKSQH